MNGLMEVSAENPFRRFLRQSGVSGYSHFQVLLSGVFDLVVTDAAKRLNEHHDLPSLHVPSKLAATAYTARHER